MLLRLLSKTIEQLPLLLLILCFLGVPMLFPLVSHEPLTIASFFFEKMFHCAVQSLWLAVGLTWLASWRRGAWWAVFAVCCILFFGELLCIFLQGSRINSAVLLILRQTSAGETAGFISMAWPRILAATGTMAAIVVAFLFVQKLWQKKAVPALSRWMSKKKKAGTCIILLILACLPMSLIRSIDAYYSHLSYWKRIGLNIAQVSSPVVYYFAVEDAFFGPYQQQIARQRENIERLRTDVSEMKDSLTVVYVIGESFSRNRSSLYGYPLPTSPLMQHYAADSSLLVFDNIVSQSNMTLDMLFPLMAVMDADSAGDATQAALLPAIFKQAGYTSAFYDNSTVPDDVSKFDFGCNFFLADLFIRRRSFDRHNTRLYDYDDLMIEAHPADTSSARSLTIYHLLGQHLPFADRFRKEEARFAPADYRRFKRLAPQQAEDVAAYDNALLHTDRVLDRIIRRLKNKCAAVVFTPDHGEEVHDFRNHVGRVLGGNNLAGSYKAIHEVPVFIWLSESFRAKYPAEVERLRHNRHKALYNTDITHTIMSLAGLRSPTYHDSLALQNAAPGRTDRVIMHTFHYDRNRETLQKVRFYYPTRE